MGGNNSAFFKARDERDRKFFMAGMAMGIQMDQDFTQLSLRDPELMGKDIFGRIRIMKLRRNIAKLDDYFSICFSKHPEADKRRDEMDKGLQEIYGDDLDPFEERYPYATKFQYDKPMKGWVK